MKFNKIARLFDRTGTLRFVTCQLFGGVELIPQFLKESMLSPVFLDKLKVTDVLLPSHQSNKKTQSMSMH